MPGYDEEKTKVAETKPEVEAVAGPIEQLVHIDCAICEDIVAESSYTNHAAECHPRNMEELNARQHQKVDELEAKVERIRQIALTCSVC